MSFNQGNCAVESDKSGLPQRSRKNDDVSLPLFSLICANTVSSHIHTLFFLWPARVVYVALAQQLRYGRATPTSFVDDVEINDNDDGVS